MTPRDFLCHAIRPACTLLAEMMGNPRYVDPRADVLLLAIALQESGLAARKQYMGGPARSVLQFELNGVRGLVLHEQTRAPLRALMARLAYPSTGSPADITSRVHMAIEHNDVLAAGLGRLNLWWYPHALPALGDEQGAWAYYLDIWRPGRPHPEKWPGNYETAMKAVGEVATP